MRTLRLVALAVLSTLVLASVAYAAKPKDGTFKGSVAQTCGGSPCTVKLSLKVKNGKVTKFTYKVGLFSRKVVPKTPLKVSKKGKFKYKHKEGTFPGATETLSGKFTSKSKVKGSYVRVSADSTLEVSKTKFTLKRK
jgi:hypothetical protein